MADLKKIFIVLTTLVHFVFSNAQESSYVPSEEEVQWAMQFSPVSGPGKPVVGNGYGGWRSGSDGVIYEGDDPKPEFKVGNRICSGSAVDEGLLPPITPAWELHLRDGVVAVGGDGYYYLTGSSGDNIWAYTKGIELWRSSDLRTWSYLGLVWDIDRDASDWVKKWRKHPRRAIRAVWAPEIHYIKDNYFICFSMCPYGIGILKSATGKAEGPYVNAFRTEESLVDAIDATLFEDEDGSVYFSCGGGGKIRKLNSDMDDFEDDWHVVTLLEPDTIAKHHASSCQKRQFKDLGHEGVVMFKHDGKYYLGAADTYEGRYSTCLAVSDNIYGPYHLRHESIPCGGGTGFFEDKEGNWWCSFFGNDSQAHFREKIGFVKVAFAKDGRVYPAKEQPFVPKKNRKMWFDKWEKMWKPLSIY